MDSTCLVTDIRLTDDWTVRVKVEPEKKIVTRCLDPTLDSTIVTVQNSSNMTTAHNIHNTKFQLHHNWLLKCKCGH